MTDERSENLWAIYHLNQAYNMLDKSGDGELGSGAKIPENELPTINEVIRYLVDIVKEIVAKED